MPKETQSEQARQPEKKENEFEVHTMPVKFLSMRGSYSVGGAKQSGRRGGAGTVRRKVVIGGLVIIALGGAMVFAAWLFLKSVGRETGQNKQVMSGPEGKTPPVGQSEETSPAAAEEEKPGADDLLDTQKWQQYANEALNYSVRYPFTWQLTHNLTAEPTADLLDYVVIKDAENYGQISVAVYANQDQTALLAWLGEKFIPADSLDSFSAAGVSGYKHIDAANGVTTVYLANGGQFYALGTQTRADAMLEQVYNQIIAGFRFTRLIPLEEKPAGDEQAPVYAPALDSDRDGLTDDEEALYGSDRNRRDTDGDSYVDGDEVANLYNPLVPGSARIYESVLVKTYVNDEYAYNLIYPSSWSTKGDSQSSIFQDAAGEFIQVLVAENDENYLNVEEWYRETINPDVSTLTNFILSGREALRSADGLRAYIMSGTKIYSLIYNPGIENKTSFMTTFDMVIKSFKFMTAGN